MRLMVIVTLVVFAVDQLSKFLIVQVMNLRSVGAIDVLPPYLNLRMAWNYGINFGLMAGDSDVMRWVLILIALAISGWVVWWVRREGGRINQISAGFLVGGALGNIVDRLVYGAVADFLNMSCCGIDNPYAFNVADIAIFIGAAGLVLAPSGAKKTP